ncbi:MAG TPA: 4-phosphopantoate--beta-alanine ligase [Thermoplasmata archaeon]|nr:4-phosphopantoate--beta-alanine ligase [Thermoplasmata archaeon]
MRIPKSHPRHASLVTREKLVKAHRDGIVVLEGLIAHGRAEAWDYLLGEESSAPALVAEKAAAAYLVTAKRPVISVNGNTAALAPRLVVSLARASSARIEINLFHRTSERVQRIAEVLRKAGATGVLGVRPNARIPGLESKRALVSREGIHAADVVLVPLEDGDRAEALAKMRKVVISIDLNPLSRTTRAAGVPVVDELTRALPNIERFVRELQADSQEARRIRREYDPARNLAAVYGFLRWRLAELVRTTKGTKGRRR